MESLQEETGREKYVLETYEKEGESNVEMKPQNTLRCLPRTNSVRVQLL